MQDSGSSSRTRRSCTSAAESIIRQCRRCRCIEAETENIKTGTMM
jgi:hypothetical protein